MRKKRVMIVDDDKVFLEELKNALVEKDIDVETVDNGAFVVRVAEEKQPDLIILDLKMAGKSGFQVADDLKHFIGTANIPVIAMTGFFTEHQHRKFMDSLGIKDCIVKPFEPEELFLKIDMYAKRHEYFCDQERVVR